MLRVPLRDRRGNVRAYALLDDSDARLAEHRWHLDAQGYAARNAPDVDGRKVRPRMHREVVGLERGDGREVDHVNGDKLDNRRANLRVVDDFINAQNRGPRGGRSRHRGVTFDAQRPARPWLARAQVAGRRVTVGRFADEDAAGAAAAAFRRDHMPGSVDPSDV